MGVPVGKSIVVGFSLLFERNNLAYFLYSNIAMKSRLMSSKI